MWYTLRIDEVIEKLKTNIDKGLSEKEVKTRENYKKAKSVIENRLNKNGVSEYLIELDETTGKIKVE